MTRQGEDTHRNQSHGVGVDTCDVLRNTPQEDGKYECSGYHPHAPAMVYLAFYLKFDGLLCEREEFQDDAP